MKLVAIHQPNFFPWLGYFNKIARSDRFCLLDNVQFPKTGGTWTNRVMLHVGQGPSWVTVPVVRGHGTHLVRDVLINETTPWRDKLLGTIRASYGRSACFQDVFPVVAELIAQRESRLAEFNRHAIVTLCRHLGLRHDHLVLASELGAQGHATELLIDLVRRCGGDAYLAGGGAGGYQQDEAFAHAVIELVYQRFEHPQYPQRAGEAFVPGLSIIDALMHLGFSRTRELVESAR